MNDHSILSLFQQMTKQIPRIHFEKDDEKCVKIEVIENRHQHSFFGIVDTQIGAGELSIAHNKRQSSYFREKTSRYHWHTPFKSNMSLE